MTANKSNSLPYVILGILALFCGSTLLGRATALAATEQPEDKTNPLDLLKGVAEARLAIKSGEMQFQVRSRWYRPSRNLTNTSRLKAVFGGSRRRFESNGTEYAYVLMGPNAGSVTDAKMQELGIGRKAAVDAGLLTAFEARYVTVYDGAALLQYRQHGERIGSTTIADPLKGSSSYVFDPRCFGLGTSLSPSTTVENSLAYEEAKSVTLVGKESVDGVSAWHVHVQSKYDESLDFWIDARRSNRLLKHAKGSDIALSKFEDTDTDNPLPTEIIVTRFRRGSIASEQRLSRANTRLNVPVDPASWTLSGLGMPVGTSVSDNRIYRRIGYWDGSGLSDSLPKGRQPQKRQPPPDSEALLSLAQKDSKSQFACVTLAWTLLNTPDGPIVEKAAKLLLRDHVQSPDLAHLCQGLERIRHQCSRELLQAFLEKNPNAEVKAHACFALASLLKSAANETGNSQTSKEAERHFRRIIDEFAHFESNGKRLAELAQPELDELQRLAVGKTAPEIESVDLEGRRNRAVRE